MTLKRKNPGSFPKKWLRVSSQSGLRKSAFIAKFKVERPTKKVAATKPVEAPKSTTENRTWKDASGKFTLQAKFGGIIGGKVLLVKEDGSKVYLTREQLSEADNKHLDEITKK